MMKNNKERILSFFDELFPNAGCELIYHKDYELLIAVMLSAQTTDQSVNKVTPILFSKYPTLEDIANADILDLEECIKTIGMYRQKARHLKSIAIDLINKFEGKVPSLKEELTSLSGVGIKTANVVRAELFNIPEIAVDTHVHRVSRRLYLAAKDDDVVEVERKLRKILPEERYIRTHHQMIHFGRYFCKAINPNCKECRLQDICRFYKTKK
jgi:endonuclease-3